ncbi:MAG: Hsp20 family protein [Lentisphaerae bacterium]|nr:Hsp20 family protein [Lentisphaerota bacterium]
MHAYTSNTTNSPRGFVHAALRACIALALLSLPPFAGAASPPPITLQSTDDTPQAVPLLRQSISALEAAVNHLEAQQPDDAEKEMARAERAFGAAQHLMGHAPPAPAHPTLAPSTAPAPRSPWDDPLGWADDDSAWNPFAEMQGMQQRMQRMFDDSMGRFQQSPAFTNAWSSQAFSPAMDVTDDGDHYTVRFDLPGVDKNQINVRLDDRILTVSGRAESAVREEDHDKTLRMERRVGQFERSLTLPGPVQTDKMDARYADGVLTVTVPKASGGGASTSVTVI